MPKQLSKQNPMAELIAAVDALLTARMEGLDKLPWSRVVGARLAVGEVVASEDQLKAVLREQISMCFRPVVSEADLCVMLRCSRTWLWDERKQGRWLNFEVDARGARLYTPEQILMNLRGERPKTNLKAA